MKKTGFVSEMLFIFLAVSSLFWGCKKESSTTTEVLVKLATSSIFGQYLVDKDGNTLYFFASDYKGKPSCTDECATTWPYFYPGSLTQDLLSSGLNLSDFDTVHVGTSPIVRYKGWPLYYYSPGGKRETSGAISGDGYNGIWYVAKPDYSIMLANAQLVGADGKNYTNTYVEGIGKTIYFTDPHGLTLYTFKKDSSDINKFTKTDFSNNASWPIYVIEMTAVPSILDKTLFSSTTVYGKKQLTYKGWPLYNSSADANIRGNNKGISVPAPGIWPVPVKDMTSAPKK